MTQVSRPYLLLTNDDGIHAEGLEALADVLEPHYDLLIVAPHRERSGAGHSITVLRDLWLEQYHRDGRHWGWSFQGKPADCVKVAFKTVSPDRPFDLVLSGINRGQNLGTNVLYSGTVAAAREGALMGIPAIAFSLYYHDIDSMQFETGAQVALTLTRRVLARGLPKGVLLNVNVPDLPLDRIEGFAITRQGDGMFHDKFEHVEGHPERNRLLRNVGERFAGSSSKDHDIDDVAVDKNRVSITPLHIDSTAHAYLTELEDLTGP